LVSSDTPRLRLLSPGRGSRKRSRRASGLNRADRQRGSIPVARHDDVARLAGRHTYDCHRPHSNLRCSTVISTLNQLPADGPKLSVVLQNKQILPSRPPFVIGTKQNTSTTLLARKERKKERQSKDTAIMSVPLLGDWRCHDRHTRAHPVAGWLPLRALTQPTLQDLGPHPTEKPRAHT